MFQITFYLFESATYVFDNELHVCEFGLSIFEIGVYLFELQFSFLNLAFTFLNSRLRCRWNCGTLGQKCALRTSYERGHAYIAPIIGFTTDSLPRNLPLILRRVS